MDYGNCDLGNVPLDILLRDLMTQDADGAKGLRVMYIEACSEEGSACDIPMTAEQVFRSCIGINDCNKPAIRLALPAVS